MKPASRSAAEPGGAAGPTFTPLIRNPRLSDKVAEELLHSITSGQFGTGTRIPSERELAEQFGVSRTVVREAVRSLAAKGVIEVVSGSGLRVAAMDASHVSEQMNLFLRARGPIDYEKINEVRTTLEIRTAGLAASRASNAEIERLRQHCVDMEASVEDREAASRADVEFHRTIARATHNELFLVMLDSIGDVLLEIRRATLGAPGRVENGLRFHRRILAAIEQHDEEAAKEAMREHLEDADVAWRGLPTGDGGSGR